MQSFLRLSLVLALAVPFAAGCGGKQTIEAGEIPASPEKWWDNPGLISDHLAVVGAAPVTNDLATSIARNVATVDARNQLAATLKARITSLAENWSKQAGDLSNEATFSNYINNEQMIQQYVNAEVSGTQAYRYQQVGRTLYVLMVLKDPTGWTANVLDSAAESALKDDTLFKTEVMKQDFRKRLEAMKAEEVGKVEKRQQAFEASLQS